MLPLLCVPADLRRQMRDHPDPDTFEHRGEIHRVDAALLGDLAQKIGRDAQSHSAAASQQRITPARIVTVSDSSGVYLRSSSARMLPITAAAAARITISIHSLKPEQIADQIQKAR